VRYLGLSVVAVALTACVVDRASPPASESPLNANDPVIVPIESNNEAERLARLWISYWELGNPQALPLAQSFVHISPFGRLEGRDHYLATVIPMSERNVTKLAIKRVLARGNEAVIWFDMHTPVGTIPVCDWVTVENGEIVKIHSFYDATTLRADYSVPISGRRHE